MTIPTNPEIEQELDHLTSYLTSHRQRKDEYRSILEEFVVFYLGSMKIQSGDKDSIIARQRFEIALLNGALAGANEELAEIQRRWGEAVFSEDIPGPKVVRAGDIDVKTTGQLIDELIIMNQRIWALIDKVIAGVATPEEAQLVQIYNSRRNEYVRAIDFHLGNEDIGAKVYNITNNAEFDSEEIMKRIQGAANVS
jgi:hypothetical protein